MKKKIISLLLSVAMLPVCFHCNAKEIVNAEDSGLLKIYKNFETNSDSETFDAVNGGYQITNDFNGSEGVFVFNAPRTYVTAILDLKENINENVLELSYDYKNCGWTNRFYIRMFSGTSNAVAETFNDYGSFGYFKDGIGWTVADHRAPYTTNKWYRINMFVNMETRMVYYYVDGKLYGYTQLKEGFTDLRQFQFVYQNSYDRTMIDNLCAIEHLSDDEKLPKEVRWTAFADTTTKANGRIFYDRNKQDLIISVGNKTENAVDYDLKLKVFNGGKFVNETTQEVHLEAGEVKDIEYTAKTNKFGFSEIIPYLYDKDGNLVFEGREYRYSVANVPPEGLKDKTMGIQMQTNVEINRNDVEGVDLPLISRLGFGASRGGLGWSQHIHKAPGVWEYDNSAWNKYSDEQWDKSGMMRIPVLAFGNPAITPENPPRSEWAIGQYAWNAARVCEWYEEYLGHPLEHIDIWNEYWMGGSGFNPDNATPEDYANMIKAAYIAIKEVSPTTTVWGLSGVNGDHYEWTERILKAGGGDYMDGYTLHPYYNKGTPDAADFPGLKKKFDELFAKYGYTDKLCWVSEWGWPSANVDGYPDERHQAAYFVEANIINTGNDLFDMTNWYSSNNVNNDKGQESNFGLIRGAYDVVGYEAKPAYISAANYMNLMIGAEHIENYDVSDNVRLYRYKLRDGRDALVGWGKELSESMKLKINASSVTLHDMFGNTEKLYGVNNEYYFVFNDVPIYITGQFDQVEKVDGVISFDKSELNMVRGDKADFVITKDFPENATVELVLPDRITVSENSGFLNNECKVVLKSEVTEKEEDNVIVKVLVGGKTIFTHELHVTYEAPIDFKIATKPYSAEQVDRWQAIVTVKGNFYDAKVGGELHINAPAAMATKNKPIKIPKLGPGEEKRIKINIPKSISKDSFTFDATLEMEGFEILEVEQTVNLRCSPFMKNKPTIDGKVTKGEWDIRTVMIMNDPDKFFELGGNIFGGLEDLSAKVYTGWDYEHFYMAVEATDNVWAWHDSLLWASDGIQFAMAPSKVGTQMAQIDMGTINDEKQVLMEISTNAANVGPVELAEFDMAREGKVTTYELKIRWKDIFPDGFTVRKNSSVPFSMLINDNDGKGRRGFMENGGGIGVFKNVYEFLDLFLLF